MKDGGRVLYSCDFSKIHRFGLFLDTISKVIGSDLHHITLVCYCHEAEYEMQNLAKRNELVSVLN